MHDFLDIYTKFIIAIISFIAPVIVYLLSVFSDGIAVITRRSKEEENQIGTLLRKKMVDEAANIDVKLIDTSNTALKESKAKNNRRIKLLDPQRQIHRIFCTLFVALFFIMLDMVVRDPQFGIYNHKLSVFLILLSFVFLF